MGRSPPSPQGLRVCQAHASEKAENWLSPDWDRDTPGQKRPGISKRQLMASPTAVGRSAGFSDSGVPRAVWGGLHGLPSAGPAQTKRGLPHSPQRKCAAGRQPGRVRVRYPGF